MDYATLTDQNQITIPLRIRDKLALKPKDKVIFYETPEGIKVIKLKNLKDFDGLIKDSKYHKKFGEKVWTERYERYENQTKS